jgi:hypothetical protein
MGADTKPFYRQLKGGSSMLAFADLIAKRAALRWLAKPHPQWTHQDLADALSMSRSWVRKWLQRLHQADPDDIMALPSRSRARHTPPASIASQPAVVQRILEIRLAPPENLQRVPGPEAILYYLHRDPALQQVGVRLPTSSMQAPRSGYTARCAAISMRKLSREVVTQFFCQHGLPSMLTFDNDPRFVGSESRPRFPLGAGALSLVCGGDTQCDSAASSRQKCLR